MAKKKPIRKNITINEKDVAKLYTKDKKSLAEIAEKYNTYPNKILRILKKHNIERRTNSESQVQAIENGRKVAPNDGSPRSESVCKAISEGMSTYWQNADESVLESHRERARDQWNNMSAPEKQEMQDKARTGILKAAKDGSKIEVLIRDCLSDNNIRFVRNKKKMLDDPKLELDIFLPDKMVAIEVDGIYHHQAIHGEEYLSKRQHVDSKKNGLCRRAGIYMIRINVLKKNVSKKDCRDLCEKLLKRLDNLPKNVRLTTIDIK